jgi:cytochrome c biogenesis protein CcdA/thiol-disulfide isomerase/thioredoxin
MILFILSFIAGVLTILAPCTLPLLPVIIGSSVDGTSNRKKAFVIAASLGVSIIIFTLLLKVSTIFISIPQSTWSVISGGIIILFGLVSLFPSLWESLPFLANFSIGSNKVLSSGYKKNSFWGDVIIGAALGPVFSTCSPTYFVILATVLPQSLFLGLVDLIAYTVGLGAMLLLIAFLGEKIVAKLGGLSNSRGWFKRSLGVLFIVFGVFVILGIDKQIEADLLSSGFFDITQIEQKLLKLNEHRSSLIINSNIPIDISPGNASSTPSQSNSKTIIPKTHGPQAPELVNPSGFINTDGKPITISQFKGKKVILLDIWTYSCINCQRTLPYVEAWYEKYKDMGLEVIGLHTPEFAFEKVKSNVEEATKKLGLTYPIVMDNEYATWNAYGNQYWPRKYLINENGEVIYDHIGEGNYEETELAIQQALSELNNTEVKEPVTVPSHVVSVSGKVRSPETYFGANRNEYFGNGNVGKLGPQTLTIPSALNSDEFYLQGPWDFSGEFVSSKQAGKMVFKYGAKNIYMVASSDAGMTVTILKDGKMEKTLFIKGNQLYTLIEGSDYSEHTLEVIVPEAGLNIFTLTFG